MSTTATMTKTSPKPTTRVRKQNDAWCVQSLVAMDNHEVWYLVGAFDTWQVAFAVAEVEASPDVWPFYMEEKHDCL